MQKSTSSLAEPPVSPSPWQDCGVALPIREAISLSPTLGLLTAIGLGGSSGKTSPVYCQADEDGTLAPSSGHWGTSGMGGLIGYSTRSLCEHADSLGPFRNDDAVCSLSDILETGDVPQRFYLTPKACSGILRRAGKRGKQLPAALASALLSVAGMDGGTPAKSAPPSERKTA